MSKTLTIAKLIEFFGAEDKSPIKIVRNNKGVTASRDDVSITLPVAEEALAPKIGTFNAVITGTASVTVTEQPAAATARRQSPAFDSL